MRIPLLCTTLLLAACSGTDAATSAGGRATAPLEPTVRDSAGIEIAEHPADAFDRAPLITIDSLPLLVIRDDEVAVQLHLVHHALVLPSGGLVIVPEQSVVFLAADGSLAARVGRLGEGPGEFLVPRLVGARGDTVLVQDQGNSRLSWVTPQGGAVTTRPFVMFSEVGSRVVVGSLRDDALVVGTMAITRPRDDAPKVDWPLSADLVMPDSDSSMRLATVRGRGLQVRRGVPERVEFEGNAQVVLASDTIVMTEGRRWEWLVVRRTGGVARIVRIVGPGQPIDPARVQEAAELEIAAIRASIVASGDEGGDTASTFADLRNKVVADTLGAIMGVWVGPDGTLWAQDGRYHFVEEPPVTYTALRPSGTILGRLVLPKDHTAIAFGDGTVVLRTEDADGFVTLKVHRLNGLR